LRTRERLASGVMPVDVAVADSARVLREVRDFARQSVSMASRVRASTDLLGEVFAADLSTMPLGQLRRLSRALIGLADAPAPNPSWADPAESYSARILLLALGDDLGEMSALRRQLYAEFSEDIWTLRCAKRLPSVERWWHSLRRRHIRGRLATVTRTGRPPSDVKRTMSMLRRANELKANVDEIWTTVSRRLGGFVDAGIPDIDGATKALAAIEQLASALGARLDPAIIHDLAVADAFVCAELTRPAIDLELTITAWCALATRMKGADLLTYSVPQVEAWAADADEALDVLAYLQDVTKPLRAGRRTVGEILQDAIRRGRVHELCGDVQL
jgi:hypothetical protein